jgi:hypothetical protein
MTLPVSRLVNVNVNLSPLPAAGRNFGKLLVVGDSDVISGLERIRDYSDAASVASDFGSTAPETLAAELYFGQNPKPTQFSVGRWIRQSTKALLEGALLSASQSAIFNFAQVTSGGFSVTIDGVVKALTGLNFSAQTNLNGVASVVTTALAGAGTCIWNGSQFVISSATSGAGVKACGTITFTANPVAGVDTITVNGIVISFVSAVTGPNQVLVGATDLITAANLNAFLVNSVSPNIKAATYSINGLVISIAAASVGLSGNSFTLAESGAYATLSHATLQGGLEPSSVSYATAPVSGTDVSGLFGLTSALALPLVPGYDAETPPAAMVAMSAKSTAWYGSMFAASVMPSDSDNLAIAALIESDPVTRMFGVTIQNSNVLSSLVTNDLASELMAGGFEQSFCMYSSSNPYACASMFGRAFSVNFTQQNSTIDLMYKQMPGVVAEVLTTEQANILQAKRCNVFVQYNNSTSILQYGVMSSPAFFDEIHGLDWLQNAIQTECYNVLYTSTTKVPQTDAGNNQFVNAIGGVCDQGINNGLGAPGVWNGPSFGQLQQGQFLKTGYYIYAQSVALQSESDRAARKAPPIQVAFKLAGSNQTVDVLVNVNR